MGADLADQRIDTVVNAEQAYLVPEIAQRRDDVALALGVFEREHLGVVLGKGIREIEDDENFELGPHGPRLSRPVNR